MGGNIYLMLKRSIRLSLASILFLLALQIGLGDLVAQSNFQIDTDYKTAAMNLVSLP